MARQEENEREQGSETWSERWNEGAQVPVSFRSVRTAAAEEGSDSEVSEIAPRLTPLLLLINASLS